MKQALLLMNILKKPKIEKLVFFVNNFSSIGTDQDAGPKVETIFVFSLYIPTNCGLWSIVI